MNRLKLTPDLFLLEVPVPRPTNMAGAQITANNHMWLFDRSGSMAGLIKSLVEDMIGKLPTLDDGDTLSVGWFSGEGQHDFILKGATIKGDASKQAIATILRKYANTVGCTCFSEILAQSNGVVDDLIALNPLVSLVFFTDGYPVVSNYAAELERISKAIAAVQGKLTSALVVGYGPYYNKELLADMAGKFGGTLVHAADLKSFSQSLTEFVTDARDNCGRVELSTTLTAHQGVMFSINGRTVVTYAPDHGKFSFVMPRKGKSSYFVLCHGANLPSVDGTSHELETPAVANDSSAQRVVYAAALVATQRTKTATALEMLGALGDVALVDGVTNAYTNDEYGKVEAKIRAAIGSPSRRFVAGRDTKHLPKRDAFCVVDAIELLMADPDLKFLPYSQDFRYNRIGLQAVPRAGTPKFVHPENPAVGVDTLTWNDSMLNLSLTCRIPGTVALDAEAAKFGFAAQYPTVIWRSYSLVKDGSANVTDVPLIMSAVTHESLRKQGVVDGTWTKDVPATVHLDRLPVMNRAMAEGKTSGKAIAAMAIKELKLEFKVKALKKIAAALEQKGARDAAARPVLTPEQTAYLEKFCIGRNGFGPPSDTVEPTDSYEAKEFTIKIAKFSSIPKPEDVEAKQKKILEATGGKVPKLTPSELLMAESLKWIDAECGRTNLTKVNATLAVLTAEMRSIRKELQKIKFAILLGKQWFDEATSREDFVVEVDGFSITFNVRNVTVQI